MVYIKIMYYIDKDFLGTAKHVVVSTGHVTLTSDKPDDLLVENGTNLPGTLQSYLKIVGREISILPPEIKNSCAVCKIPVDITGLSYLMRSEEFSKNLAEFNSKIKNAISDNIGYIPFYTNNIQTLNSCVSIKFSKANNFPGLDSAGYASKITYETSTTKTGRMSIVTGPNVLTMKKNVKQDIVSRFPNGKIIEIDYSALEPRVALAIAGSVFAKTADVYSALGKVVDIPDRNIAKQLIISFLYGAGAGMMCRLTGLANTDLQVRLTKLKKIFNQDLVIEKIKLDLENKGYFYNHAGRPIHPTSDRFGVLFNNFCQSTAVDVSLSGFSSLIKSIKLAGMTTQPICFIHDAVLFDVPSDEVDTLSEMSKELPTYLGIDFPTKLTVMDSYKQ